jgi:hypothetical protein
MAKRYLGVPYVFGGTTQKGLDCSGLVQLVYKNLGINLPRLVRHQRLQGRAVASVKAAQPGDLLVFNGYQHIGIYIGNNMMIAAPQPGEKVKIQSVYQKPTSIRRIVGDGGYGATANYNDIDMGLGEGESKKLDINTLASNYGYSLAFFKSNPELWALINQAVKGDFTSQEFQARLKNTQWYKKNSQSTREWYTLERVDPSTAKAKLAQTASRITQLANQQGVGMASKRVWDMAWRVNAYGWDEGQIATALAAEMRFDPKRLNYIGGLGVKHAEIVKQANAYGIQLTEGTIFSLMKQMVGQKTTDEAVLDYIKKQAKVRYAGLADDIDKGMTVMDYASPFIQTQARLLELDPADVNLFDSHIQKALQYKDPKTGKASPMSLFSFETAVRGDNRWLKTKNARDSLLTGSRQILTDWGLA